MCCCRYEKTGVQPEWYVPDLGRKKGDVEVEVNEEEKPKKKAARKRSAAAKKAKKDDSDTGSFGSVVSRVMNDRSHLVCDAVVPAGSTLVRSHVGQAMNLSESVDTELDDRLPDAADASLPPAAVEAHWVGVQSMACNDYVGATELPTKKAQEWSNEDIIVISDSESE